MFPLIYPEYFHFDANLVIDYILDVEDTAKGLNKYFNPSNRGKRLIIMSIDELGEISKRVSRHFYENSGSLTTQIQNKIIHLIELVKTGYIKLFGFKELISEDKKKLKEFSQIVEKLSDMLDNRVQLSDRVHLSLFAFDEAGVYYTNDKNVLESRKLVNYFKEEHDKSIKELS